MKSIIQPVSASQHFLFNMTVACEQTGLYDMPLINMSAVLQMRHDDTICMIVFKDFSKIALIRKGKYVRPVADVDQLAPSYIPN
jgi:hypothetical protein